MSTLEQQKLEKCLTKIKNEQQHYKKAFDELNSSCQKQFLQQFNIYFKNHQEKFSKSKKNFTKQLNTLNYYKQNPSQKDNLYPLFNQIEQKINFNLSIIRDISFSILLPYPSPLHLQQNTTERKISLYENLVKDLVGLLKSDNVRKYCKKQSEKAEELSSSYRKMIQKSKQFLYEYQVSIKKPFDEGLSHLIQYRHVEDLSLFLRSQKGILSTQQYQNLVNSLLPNHPFIKNLNLKISDMQFCQQKCDILRKRLLNQFKNLKSLKIHNYYKECKLGIFEDFNWHPLRKQINIFSKVW